MTSQLKEHGLELRTSDCSLRLLPVKLDKKDHFVVVDRKMNTIDYFLK